MWNSAYEEHIATEGTREDYMREAYGQPCGCGTLTWGGDCPKCMHDEASEPMSPAEYAAFLALLPAEERAARIDDDIPF